MKRTISILLALVMILSTMSMGVFAVEGQGSDTAAQGQPTAEASETDTISDEDVNETPEEAPEIGIEENAAPDASANSEPKAADSNTTPRKLTSVRVVKTSTTSATVAWAERPGYTVTVTPITNDTEGETVENLTGVKKEITGLIPGTTYSFRVQLIDTDGTLLDEQYVEDITLPFTPVTGLYTYSAYNSIALEWNPVPGATGYNVYRDNKLIRRNVWPVRSLYDAKKLVYIDKIYDDKAHKYTVTALKKGLESAKCAVKSDARVITMYVSITFNKARKLTSHDSGKKVTTRFGKNFTVNAHGYRLGRYHFRYKGHTYYVNYMSTKNTKAKYTKKFNYTNREAEYFIRTSGVKSKTQYAIWTSLYCQHLYVLKKDSRGVFRVTNIKYKGISGSNWEISSGKASTPSPTGLNLQIFRRQANKRGVVWWNYFHSQTSIHGKAGSAPFGMPASSGCVRNPDTKASLIYHVVPLKTRVMTF